MTFALKGAYPTVGSLLVLSRRWCYRRIWCCNHCWHPLSVFFVWEGLPYPQLLPRCIKLITSCSHLMGRVSLTFVLPHTSFWPSDATLGSIVGNHILFARKFQYEAWHKLFQLVCHPYNLLSCSWGSWYLGRASVSLLLVSGKHLLPCLPPVCWSESVNQMELHIASSRNIEKLAHPLLKGSSWGTSPGCRLSSCRTISLLRCPHQCRCWTNHLRSCILGALRCTWIFLWEEWWKHRLCFLVLNATLENL